ncbi:MAG TPA: hypothetical protein VJB08_04415 [Candidatus Nanoarchaeia archaeon]|nr:hypothetical protein [Candidatus Nanoarchaeia archaeon]
MKTQEMTALDKDVVSMIKKECLYLIYIVLGLIILLKIIFYNESFLVTTRIAALLWWMFILPGWSLMLYWQSKLDFLERVVIGAGIGIAVFGVVGYNLSIIGLDLKYHSVIIPLVMLLVGGWIIWRSASRRESSI